MKVVEDFESRPHKAVSYVSREKRRCRNGMSRGCLRRCLAAVEGGCQEEAHERNRSRSGCGRQEEGKCV